MEYMPTRRYLTITEDTPHGIASTYTNYRCRCEPCRTAKSAYAADRYASRDKELVRAYEYNKRYGITIEDYNQLFEKQGGACGICRKPERQRHHLSVDHDHLSGKVRGLLCTTCNKALGHLGDSVAGLQRAIDYLQQG